MERPKKLSVVLPTYNRCNYLKETLKSFEHQVKRNSNEITFVICDNASTDETANCLKEFTTFYPMFSYIRYEDHVSIGNSIVRSIDNAVGEYVLLWGDDDLPSPFLIDTILDVLSQHPDISVVHYNRCFGTDDHVSYLKKVQLMQKHIGDSLLLSITTNKLIFNYIKDMSFLSSLVFKREIWNGNRDVDCSKHYGYEFLGRILFNTIDKENIYIQYPMCIQRIPYKRSWMQKSVLYRFIGMPNMYQDFEKWGLVKNAKELWMKNGNSIRDFLVIMPQASMFKSTYRPLFKEILKHQHTFGRKFFTWLCIFVLPGFVYQSIRNIVFKYK